MKPRNFPQRRNLRRQRALARLMARLPEAAAEITFAQRNEMKALNNRIVPDARGVRTKKRRGPPSKRHREQSQSPDAA